MSLDSLRKRLAKLEQAKRRIRFQAGEMTETELARAVAFILQCGVEGVGGNQMLTAASDIACMLTQVPLLTPEQIEAGRARRAKAHLKHAV